MNAVGIGAFFNLLNFGQMYSIHIAGMPLVIAGPIGLHPVLVRRRGLVPPFADDAGPGAEAAKVWMLSPSRVSHTLATGRAPPHPCPPTGCSPSGGRLVIRPGSEPGAQPRGGGAGSSPGSEDAFGAEGRSRAADGAARAVARHSPPLASGRVEPAP